MQDGDDLTIFARSDFELRQNLRLDLHEPKFLIFLKHQLSGPAGDFRQMSDIRIEPGRGSRATECSAVPLVDESHLRRFNAETAGNRIARRINALTHAPERELVAIPFGDAAAGLERNRNAAAKGVGEFLNDV